MPRFKLFTLIVCLFLLGGNVPGLMFSSCLNAAPSPSAVEHKISQIENRVAGWILFQAALSLRFITADNQTASCNGSLLYERLNEKILLQCAGDNGKTLFVFKSEDRQFELFIPERKTLFCGNIFDLNDSSEIESRLKPLDFYRALKPAAIPISKTEMEFRDHDYAFLKIRNESRGISYLARTVLARPEGDISQETYYGWDGKPRTSIQRSEFRTIRIPNSLRQLKIVFPFRIETESLPKKEKMVMEFREVKFPPAIPAASWQFPYPPDTERIELNQLFKNPPTVKNYYQDDPGTTS